MGTSIKVFLKKNILIKKFSNEVHFSYFILKVNNFIIFFFDQKISYKYDQLCLIKDFVSFEDHVGYKTTMAIIIIEKPS